MEQASAFAIKLPPITAGPDDLVGMAPVVIFPQRGGMSQRNLAAVLGGGDGQLQIGAAARGGVSSASSITTDGGPHIDRFDLEQIVIVFDASNSMNSQVSGSDRRTKLTLMQQEFAGFGADFFPSAQISIIEFNAGARVVRLAHASQVVQAISEIRTAGGTNFAEALQLTNDCLASGTLQGRKAVIFVSDGDDKGLHDRALELARGIRAQNAFTFLVGAGAEYKIGRHLGLAQCFGAAAWAHSPMPAGRNILGALLPSVLRELQTNEFYLRVRAESDVRGFHWLTPSVRAADEKVAYVGYESGRGVCFVDPVKKDPDLKLISGTHYSDPSPTTSAIKIITPREAAAQLDELKLARNSVAPLLILLAQLKGDVDLLDILRGTYPRMATIIDTMFSPTGKGDSPESRMERLQGMSELGTDAGIKRLKPHFVNPYSQIGEPDKGAAAGRGDGPDQKKGGHSGALGPLTYGATNAGRPMPEMGNPDAREYDLHDYPVLSYNDPCNGQQNFNLFSIADGITATVGRQRGADIWVCDQHVSRTHAHIIREGNTFLVADAGSAGGTMVNGKKLGEGEHELREGDTIQVGNVLMRFAINRDGADK